MRGGSLQTRRFPAMTALVCHPRQGKLLFDTGYAQRFFSETAKWPFSLYRRITPVYLAAGESVAEQLWARRIPPEEIRYIFLSHLHADHIGGCLDFPQAQFIAAQEAYEAVCRLPDCRALCAGFIPGLLPRDFARRLRPAALFPRLDIGAEHAPFQKGFDLFGDGSALAVPLPGHAAGQMGLLLPETASGGWFLVGDACWSRRSYLAQIPPHWAARAVTHSWKAYVETLRAIGAYAASHLKISVVPSHCQETMEEIANVGQNAFSSAVFEDKVSPFRR